MLKELDNYNWAESFKYAGEDANDYSKACPDINPTQDNPKCSLTPFSRESVEEIYCMCEGENDELSWIIMGKLKDDRYFYLEASCDYTGWGCQESGRTWVTSLGETSLWHFGCNSDARERFKVKWKEMHKAGLISDEDMFLRFL